MEDQENDRDRQDVEIIRIQLTNGLLEYNHGHKAWKTEGKIYPRHLRLMERLSQFAMNNDWRGEGK